MGNLIILDAFNFAFRFKRGSKVFAETYVSTVLSFAKSYDATKVIITADGKGGSHWRKDIFPEYKANRIKDQSPEEEEEFKQFFNEYLRALDLCEKKFHVIRIEGVEADDVASFIVSNGLDFNFQHTWLISSDKDWLQLVGPNTSYFSFLTRKEVSYAQWDELVSIPYQYFLGYKVLNGDKSDNIPGIKGVGEKRAIAILRPYEGDIYELMAALPIEGSSSYVSSVNAGKDIIERNIKLMDLQGFCAEAVGKENYTTIERLF